MGWPGGARPWFLALLLALAAGPAWAADEFESRSFTNTLRKSLSYRLLSPLVQSDNEKFPLVLFLHGEAERGSDNLSQLKYLSNLFAKESARKKYPCFVLAPQCPDRSAWNGQATADGKKIEPADAPIRLVWELVYELSKEFPVDLDRLYLLGHEMGGSAVWDSLALFPDRLAAAVPIAGEADFKRLGPASAKVAVWAFHSANDTETHSETFYRLVNAMRNGGGKTLAFEYFAPKRTAPEQAYAEPELLAWMFSQKRGKPDAFELNADALDNPNPGVWPTADGLVPGAGPTQRGDWFTKVSKEIREEWWKNREQDKGAVVFLGDSVLQGWTNLAESFPSLRVANRALAGDTSRGARHRLKQDVQDLNPAAVVVMVGPNDLGLDGEPVDTVENIGQIAVSLRNGNPKLPVVLCHLPPRGASAGQFPEKIRQVNAGIDALAAANPGLVVCDTFTPCADADGQPSRAEFPDLFHPNAKAFEKWKALLAPIFAKLDLAAAAKK